MIVLQLYTESIKSTEFIARNCITYMKYLRGDCLDNAQAIMGENCNPRARGVFFLDLNEESPYAMGTNSKEGSTEVNVLCQLPDGSIQFYLFNTNYHDGIEIHNLSLIDLEIDPSQPLKIWFHGITTNSTANWDEANTEAYIDRGYNFIAVDYYDYSFIYVTVIEQFDDMTVLIGDFLMKFCEELSVAYADIHMLGHSLGAHLAGQVGRYIYNNTSEKVGRITALDPTNMLFNAIYSNKRLRRTDAVFVDAIHTSFLSPITFAHADFYPNGGIVGDILVAEKNSHLIVLDLYSESIDSRDFVARNCNTYRNYLRGNCLDNVQAIMGENCDPTTRGVFFLDLNEDSPYATGSNTKENSEEGSGGIGLSASNTYYLSIIMYSLHRHVLSKLFRS